MLITPVSSQSFGLSKYNLADYSSYRSASAPISYYNDNSNKKSIENLASILLNGDVEENKTGAENKLTKKKPKFRLFREINRFSEVIARTYNVLVGEKIAKYRELADKIL